LESLKSGYEIRPATNKDIPQIVALVKSILPEFGLTYSPDSSEKDLLDIEATYMNSGGTFEVIEHRKSAIIGTVGLLKVDESTIKLRKMYVDRSYRGLGLGKRLMEHALYKAAELQFEEIVLETVHSMTAAISLYEAYGFIKIGTGKADSPRCDIIMRRTIYK
jgi:putative acetyltransferase